MVSCTSTLYSIFVGPLFPRFRLFLVRRRTPTKARSRCRLPIGFAYKDSVRYLLRGRRDLRASLNVAGCENQTNRTRCGNANVHVKLAQTTGPCTRPHRSSLGHIFPCKYGRARKLDSDGEVNKVFRKSASSDRSGHRS